MKKFEVLKIPLEGKNLIEASAGTGKTYSVTMMALRLIIEKEIPVNQILMVTFTEAAAAEMAERLVSLIDKARSKPDKDLQILLSRNPNSAVLLENAALACDQLSIYTIHGFCNKTLTEFAFESNNSFGFQIVSSDKEIWPTLFQQLWRKEFILMNRYSVYFKDIFDHLLKLLSDKPEDVENCIQKIIEKSNAKEESEIGELKNNLELMRSQTILATEAFKKRNALLTYDDLIHKVFEVSQDEKRRINLSNALEKKYKALFIDEFQDTDQFQYHIFSQLFPQTIQFFVGDPKQSIYKFRGADLNSYLKVKLRPEINSYSMNKNYRSSSLMIDALNDFYMLQTNPFHNEQIQYVKVEPQKPASFIKDAQTNQSFQPLSIFFSDWLKDGLIQSVVQRILYYLQFGRLVDDNKERAVQPNDIVVLNRSKNNSELIRNELVKLGVPAITIDGTNVLSTSEAELVSIALQLLIEPNQNYLVQLLLHPFMGYAVAEIETYDFSQEITKIKTMKSIFFKEGIYNALISIIHNYHREQRLQEKYGLVYNRMKSNVLQILDILHNKVEVDKLELEALPQWLNREKNVVSEGGFYEQKLESDEQAVRLMTIHKSKGLEFGITILPFFSSSFEDDEEYRVLYVAMTRAKFKLDVICSKSKRSSYKLYVDMLSQLQGRCSFFEELRADIPYRSFALNQSQQKSLNDPFPREVDRSWKLTSYSALALHSHYEPYLKELSADSYDVFVFEQLPKGPQWGTLLHSILEQIDFQGLDFSAELKSMASSFIAEADYGKYNQFLQQIIQADLGGFSLSKLAPNKRWNEFEYHLQLKDEIQIEELNGFLQPYTSLQKTYIKGVLKGFIDMIFEYQGKYYILDWKSNYLGNHLEAYQGEHIISAIQSNSYNLQYLIYSVAVDAFLRQRIPAYDYEKNFGGGFWIFLRGARKNSQSGVHHFTPDLNELEKFKKLFFA